MIQTMGWLDWKRYRGEETLTGGNAECWLDLRRCRYGSGAGTDAGVVGSRVGDDVMTG